MCLSCVPLLASVLAGCIPDRDNANDPTLRPQARAVVYVLVPVGSAADGNVTVDGGYFRAAEQSLRPGGASSLFLVDARASTDPNTDFENLTFSFDLEGDGTSDSVPEGVNHCPSPSLHDDGVDEGKACFLVRPEQLQAVVGTNGFPARNAPIPIVVRVADERNRRHDITVDVRVNDALPQGDAGADYVLPLKTCPPGPDCTY